mmetsp:Transcript_85787/g.255760  ORF Transcript_85787/g.255760 Transcript_85787/m.255760 type:complete len:210 (+) Transcript_85787:318-947(+)
MAAACGPRGTASACGPGRRPGLAAASRSAAWSCPLRPAWWASHAPAGCPSAGSGSQGPARLAAPVARQRAVPRSGAVCRGRQRRAASGRAASVGRRSLGPSVRPGPPFPRPAAAAPRRSQRRSTLLRRGRRCPGAPRRGCQTSGRRPGRRGGLRASTRTEASRGSTAGSASPCTQASRPACGACPAPRTRSRGPAVHGPCSGGPSARRS